jgi:hypothetical protein
MEYGKVPEFVKTRPIRKDESLKKRAEWFRMGWKIHYDVLEIVCSWFYYNLLFKAINNLFI